MKRWLVIGTLATALGACHLLIGLDKFESNTEAGTGGATISAIASGGAAGIAGTAGTAGTEGGAAGSGGAPMCEPTPTPTGPTSCPPICEGGCANGTCNIWCDSSLECQNQILLCPEGVHCVFHCTSAGSCNTAKLYCPPSYSCTLECTECDACAFAELHCDDGPCLLRCQNCETGCQGTQQLCGPNSCTRWCSEPWPLLPQPVDCDGSCDCQDNGCSVGGAGGIAG